jgi:hypothetical protein
MKMGIRSQNVADAQITDRLDVHSATGVTVSSRQSKSTAVELFINPLAQQRSSAYAGNVQKGICFTTRFLRTRRRMFQAHPNNLRHARARPQSLFPAEALVEFVRKEDCGPLHICIMTHMCSAPGLSGSALEGVGLPPLTPQSRHAAQLCRPSSGSGLPCSGCLTGDKS